MFVLLASLVATGCASPSTTSPVTASTAPSSTTEFEAPSYEALVKGGFTDPSVPRITSEDLKKRLDTGDKIILIDTRKDSWFEEGHLAGSINIHYAINSPIPGAEEAMDKELSALPNDVLKVLYCN